MPAATRARQWRAPPFIEPPGYARHRPETTLLYQLVEQRDPHFRRASVPDDANQREVYG